MSGETIQRQILYHSKKGDSVLTVTIRDLHKIHLYIEGLNVLMSGYTHAFLHDEMLKQEIFYGARRLLEKAASFPLRIDIETLAMGFTMAKVFTPEDEIFEWLRFDCNPDREFLLVTDVYPSEWLTVQTLLTYYELGKDNLAIYRILQHLADGQYEDFPLESLTYEYKTQ